MDKSNSALKKLGKKDRCDHKQFLPQLVWVYVRSTRTGKWLAMERGHIRYKKFQQINFFVSRKWISRFIIIILILIELHSLNRPEGKLHDFIIQEAQLLKELQSTYLIQYHDFAIEGTQIYIIMEYAPNGTLEDKIYVCIIIRFICLLSLLCL